MSSNDSTISGNVDHTAQECSFVQPSLISLLVVNVLLLLFLSYKIIKFIFMKPETKLERKTKNYRVIILAFIFLSLLVRAFFGFYKLFTPNNGYSNGDSALSVGLIAFNCIPIAFFVSIASVFSYYWHNLYTSFERANGSANRRSKIFKVFLIAANASLYVIFAALITVSLTTQWAYSLLALNILFMVYLIISTAMLAVHGTRLYDRALKLMTYAGNVVKSTSGFLVTYRTLLFCCAIKTINCAASIYFEVTGTFIKIMFRADGQCDIWIWTAYMLTFIIIGEYVMYASLILLLDFNANKAKTGSVDDRTQVVVDGRSLLGEGREYSPFVMESPGNEESGAESV